MAKSQMQHFSKKERYEMIGRFYDTVTHLKTKKDIIGFFMGLLTPSEALMFARRIHIAQMLLDEKTYHEIETELKVGKSTIMNVARWLNGEDAFFRNNIINQSKREQTQKKDRYYSTSLRLILSPYRQTRLLKEFLDR